MSLAATDITVSLLEERFAASELADDPTDVILPLDVSKWPKEWLAAMPRSLRPAAVLIPVFEREEGLALLFTLRSQELKHHAGQISFPGGRLEESDADVIAAALRETHEEIGVGPEHVRVLGSMGAMATVTGYAVTPIIGAVSRDAELSLDPYEVAGAFEVPLSYFLDEGNFVDHHREYLGHKIPGVEFHFEGKRIWGATAHMIREFIKILQKE